MQCLKNAFAFGAIFILCSFEINAQNAEKLLEDFLIKMWEIKSGEMSYTTKWKPFYQKDTLRNSVNLSFVHTNHPDSFIFIAKDEKTIFVYDYENFYRAFVKNNQLYVRGYNWKDVYANFFFANYIPVTAKGYELVEQKPKRQLSASDTISNGKKYKLLHLYASSIQEDSSSQIINYFYFLEPKTLVPERYIFTVEGLGDYQYVELNLKSYKFNHLREQKFKKTIQEKIGELTTKFKVMPNQSAAEFNKNTLDSGKSAPFFTLAKFGRDSCFFPKKEAKVYLLDFWYISCYPCQLAIPHIQKLYMQYAKNGLEVVGVDIYEKDTAFLPDLKKSKGITYPIALNGKAVAEKYGVKAYPTLFLVNREGKIIYRTVGFSKDAMKEMEDIIQRELNSIKN